MSKESPNFCGISVIVLSVGIKKHNGIVLISVMFLTVLIGMYVASTLILSRGQLLTGQQSQESQLAESAAFPVAKNRKKARLTSRSTFFI